MTNLPATLDTTRERVFNSIANADLADSTKHQYRRAVERYLDDTGARLTDAGALASWAAEQSQSTRGFLKAAVGKWAEHMSNAVKGQATPDNVAEVQASLYRFEALQNAIETNGSKGQKTHTWLSPVEVKKLRGLVGGDIYGRRDAVALGLLVGAGLRRAEAVAVTFDDVKLQPVKGKMRTVIDVTGKGSKARTVPISDNLANLLDAWGSEIGHEGRVLRSLGRNRIPGDSLSPVGLFNIVRGYGEQLAETIESRDRRQQVASLAPHDLRRTYAKIGHDSGVPVSQISQLLGHANIATTQRYLGLEIDLATTASDFVPW